LVGFARLKSKFAYYSKVHLRNGMSGKEIAEKMLHDNGIYDVQVISVPGQLTDHYNPANKTVNLSEAVYMQEMQLLLLLLLTNVDTLCNMLLAILCFN
jgi:Zn-dependent membrane protease YugP